jgi:hypothetical protein
MVAERLEQFCGCSRSIATLGINVHTVGVMVEHTDAQTLNIRTNFIHIRSPWWWGNDAVTDSGAVYGVEQCRSIGDGVRHCELHAETSFVTEWCKRHSATTRFQSDEPVA